jgi:pyruvate/2-oxoglutarate dehydrogenase complex dihydrolipoamide acyltransferase (E2) component
MWEFLPVAMSVISSVIGAQGASDAGAAAALAGQRKRAADEFAAQQADINAVQAVAASQRSALEVERQGKLLQSRALALAAASGGGTGGSVVDVIARLSGETALRKATALYDGEEKARVMRMQAQAQRFEGAAAEETGQAQQGAYQTAAIGSLFKGGASLFTNYANGGFKGSTSPIGTGGINWDLV